MADMQMFEIERFHSVMSISQFRDSKMALGLYTSGVGCGSFLYLRRIMEELVSEASKELTKESGWSEKEFDGKRFCRGFGKDYVSG